MEAQIITNQQQWDEFVAGMEQCNVTQSYEWGQLLTGMDGEALYVGVVDDEGKMHAAMLLFVSRVAVSNSVYFYAPRGPIIDDPDSPVMTVLLNYVKALARRYHAFMLKIEPGVADNDPKWLSALHRRGFVANPQALHLRHEWVLDVRPDEQALLAGMKKTWRYCVRLASRKDVTVRRGESLADIDIFYRILQTTSQRDTFMIYDKSFYERLVELYGQSQNVALFIAEYEGQPLGAALLITMGRWCWYMYGASSNEHRDRMPNHLLQWTAIRWAKEQGCWYYNFRGIPDVLEEGQPMWGVYVFKSGFGGYATRSLETHDLPYNPLLYRLYRGWLDGRSWLKDVRARRHAVQLAAEKQEKQNDGEPAHVEQATKAPPEQAAVELEPDKSAKKHAERSERPARASNKPTSPTSPVRAEHGQQLPQSQTEHIQSSQGPAAQITHENRSAYLETNMYDVQLAERRETGDEQGAPGEGQAANPPLGIETAAEQRETTDKPEPPREAQTEPLQVGAENPQEHMETADENESPEPELQPYVSQPTQEEPEDEDVLNEVTQKLPRIQMAQKHTTAKKLEN